MYVAANIDDCAIIINDFLSPDLFKKISNYNYKNSFSNSHSEWQEELYSDNNKNETMKNIKYIRGLATIEKEQITFQDLIFKEFLESIINCSFIPYKKNSNIEVSYYEYQKHSGINWHDDGDYTLNYSFYIHDEWNNNWGGETLIDTKRGLPLVTLPIPNSLLVIKNGIKHKVCLVGGPKKRKVLQIRGIFYK